MLKSRIASYICVSLLLVFVLSCASTKSRDVNEGSGTLHEEWGEEPEWFIPLRDAVYGQILSGNDAYPLYVTAIDNAGIILAEAERYTMLARSEIMMGRIYQREGNKSEAAACYNRAKSFSQSALKILSSSKTRYALAESINWLCNVNRIFYQMFNGFSFMYNVNEAVRLDSRNSAAKYLLVNRYAFAPPPFGNLTKARELLEDILENNNDYMQKDTRFDVYYAMGFISQKQKRLEDARKWFEMALVLYPTNNDVQNRLGEI